MLIDSSAVSSVLTALVVEDRNDSRIWRARLENVASAALIASFAISAFFMERAKPESANRLTTVTVLADICLSALMTIFFIRFRRNLTGLRKAQAYRQNLLKQAVNGKLTTFDPFINLAKTGPNAEKIRPGRKTKIEPDLEKPGPESAESEDWIEDEDMNLLFGLTVGAILLKMFVVVFWSQWLLKF